MFLLLLATWGWDQVRNGAGKSPKPAWKPRDSFAGAPAGALRTNEPTLELSQTLLGDRDCQYFEQDKGQGVISASLGGPLSPGTETAFTGRRGPM